jgi:hypothetical protein
MPSSAVVQVDGEVIGYSLLGITGLAVLSAALVSAVASLFRSQSNLVRLLMQYYESGVPYVCAIAALHFRRVKYLAAGAVY